MDNNAEIQDSGPAQGPALPTKIDELVGQYVRLRDTLKKSDDQHAERTKAAREYLARINGALLEHLQATGGDSVKTKFGTAYLSARKSATVQDMDGFRRHVIGSEAWELADWRANATAIQDFINEHNGELPPGVGFSVTNTVGVRRA